MTLLLALFLLAGRAQAAEGYAVQKVEVSGNQATATVTAEQPCTLFAALYDKDGKMLDVTTVSVPAGTNQEEPLDLDLEQDRTDSVKVFLTKTGTAAPLCKAKSTPLSSDVYAILSDYGKTLTFYNKLPEGASLYDGKTWKVREYYNHDYYDDDTYKQYVDHVFPPWAPTSEEQFAASNVETVIFAEDIRPTSTACWFYKCGNLTTIEGIEHLDTSNVTDMSHMFYFCYDLPRLDVSGFDTSRVTDMSNMFYYCKNLTDLDLSGFDTSSVTDMSSMFCWCYGLTGLDLSGFDTSCVTDMSNMFNDCRSLTSLEVSGFDTSCVTNMTFMFMDCKKLSSLDISGFDTSSVKNMWGTFEGCSNLSSLDVSGFDTSCVTNMAHMFSGCGSLTSLDVSGFDTSCATDIKSMFSWCLSLTSLDVSGFDTSSVTDMTQMFDTCESLQTIWASSSFVTSQAKYSDALFYNCQNLTGGNGTTYDKAHTDAEYARIDTPDAPGYFTAKT